MYKKEDKKFIQKCIRLSEESFKKSDTPFGSLIVKDGKIIIEALNNSRKKVSDHSEIIALHKARKLLGTSDLSSCILYSNCEPCPMCAFMIREYKIKRVVFAIKSPVMGGLSKWNILKDNNLSEYKPFFSTSPQVTHFTPLENDAKKILDKGGFWMFGNNVEKEQKLRDFAKSSLDNPKYKNKIKKILSKLKLSEDEVVQAYADYDMDIFAYKNEIYKSIALRVALYLHYTLKGSWHQERQEVILNFIKRVKPKSVIDIGFGAPTKYIEEYVIKNKVNLTLIDLYESAFRFTEIFLGLISKNWKKFISFKKFDMNKNEFVGDYDCYIFQDSIEHAKNPSKFLKKTVQMSSNKSSFIISLPIGPKIPSHNISWKTEKEAINWLKIYGLKVGYRKKVYINPSVDLFAEQLKDEFYNLVVLCSKK